MTTRLIPYSSLEASPWKNGGGSTTEIAIAPGGASFHDFDWRVSLATIGHDGPFSVFEGIDRTLALVEGRGVLLDIDGGKRKAVLDEASPVFEFAGEHGVEALLVDGPTRDFNVMTRRDVCDHQLGRRELSGQCEFAPRGDVTLMFLASGDGLELRNGDERISLVRYDTVAFEGPSRWTLDATDATVFVVDITYA
ncbi:MAG TPA: HutD family protein [Telluria sp.]|nr:HutD family protein [Telluria sp.]